MSAYLLSLDNLIAQVRDVAHSYLLPVGIAMMLLAMLLVFLIGRGSTPQKSNGAKSSSESALDTLPSTMITTSDVLVVDDSAVVRAKLRKLFESGGLTVDVAKDGLDALECLERRFYSVLLTDLEMPNMDGFQLIAHVQGSIETEDLPIVAITGHDEMHAHVRDFQGLYGIFKKPWNDRDLLERIKTLSTLRTKKKITKSASAAKNVNRDALGAVQFS